MGHISYESPASFRLGLYRPITLLLLWYYEELYNFLYVRFTWGKKAKGKLTDLLLL
jgi:hypothetical protein